MCEWIGFAGSVIGGLIGGLFTYIGVRLTLKHEKEKEQKEELKNAQDTKPRLEIVKYSDFEATKSNVEQNNDCNVLALKIRDFKDNSRARFYYDESALDENQLVYAEYELKNTGLTEIVDICITSNLRQMSIIELEKRDLCLKNNYPNCDVWSENRYIKPGQTFKLRIYYIKDQIVISNLGNPVLTIWLNDVNGRIWSQTLYTPGKNIEISRIRNYKEFSDSRDLGNVIDYYKNSL